jgi:hypothetical protein
VLDEGQAGGSGDGVGAGDQAEIVVEMSVSAFVGEF